MGGMKLEVLVPVVQVSPNAGRLFRRHRQAL